MFKVRDFVFLLLMIVFLALCWSIAMAQIPAYNYNSGEYVSIIVPNDPASFDPEDLDDVTVGSMVHVYHYNSGTYTMEYVQKTNPQSNTMSTFDLMNGSEENTYDY